MLQTMTQAYGAPRASTQKFCDRGNQRAMTTREKSPAPRNTPTFTHDSPQQQQAASAQPPTLLATSEGLSPFLTVLVTPKLNFSLPRQPQWRTPEDIGQEEVRPAPPVVTTDK